MGIEIPEEFGGAGGSFFDAVLAIEAISTVDPAVAVLVDVHNTLVINALRRWATEPQQRHWLPRLAADTVGAYALSEAGSGSDAFALQTRAASSRRRAIASTAASSGSATRAKPGCSSSSPPSILRPATAASPHSWSRKTPPGFTVGRKEDKLGIRASSTCELIFDNCLVIPGDNLLGEPGKGYKIAIETLNEGRIGIGAQMLGLAEGAWGHAARYAQERRQFGKAIAEFQAVQFTLAEMATEIEAARLMVYNAARLKDAGQTYVREAAMAKLFASQVAERVASQCVEVFGGNGFVRDYPGREILSRRQGRQDLRRHLEHAASHHRQTGPQAPRLAFRLPALFRAVQSLTIDENSVPALNLRAPSFRLLTGERVGDLSLVLSLFRTRATRFGHESGGPID